MFLTQFLHRIAQTRPTATDVACDDTNCGYAGLRDQAARMAAALQALGITAAGRCVVDEYGVQEFCRGLLANYKCPKSLEFFNALPLTATGKVAKILLLEPHWHGMARRIG